MGNNKSKSSSSGNRDLATIESEYALKSLLKFQSHEFLVFGYVRTEIEPFILLGIPHEMLQLIISYYNVGIHAHILLWCGSEQRTDRNYNQIHILNIKNHKKYKLSVYNLDNKLMKPAKTHYFDRLHCSYCSISGVKLPQWVLKMEYAQQHVSVHKKYHIVFRFGGILKYEPQNQLYAHSCDMLMIDSTKLSAIHNRSAIDSYFCTIPTSLLGQYSDYNDYSMCYNNNFLTLCGGVGADQQATKTIKRFDLQTLTWDDDKFIKRRLIHARNGISCCLMQKPSPTIQSDAHPLICIGGMNNGRFYGRFSSIVEMYSFIDNKSVKLASLKRQRYLCGSVYLPFNQQIVCVGGNTYSGSKEIELYDVNKDCWRILKKKSMFSHLRRPLVWTDEMNCNILYIAGESFSNAKRNRLGQFEMMDMRMETSWKSFGGKDLISLLELRRSDDVFNDWEVRTGLII